ncbi:cell wall-associated NlpC family hydrolase [Nonomuraea roseoviolacea subsp. carminata]|uniref:Cell wall-associated NlpC family hydrolase n=1 Tax=Nonomuraea roseoviolacea subsp. carminata TaxID=160689 RepID=A0ABT1JSX3_9ACTN|nr:cell wall-associated NlpC family hydrolase [Nonomuraea roseoviolacea subsp. carminata]
MTAGGLVLHAPAAQAQGTTSTTAGFSSVSAGTAAASVKQATRKSAKASKAVRQQARAHTAVAVAKAQIGDPYRYGGTGPGAFDCSGLVQYAWKKAGVRIPRVTNSQYARIKKKVSWKHLKPGDLMFFRGLGHVGMYVGHGKMVHSPRTGLTVRIEKLSGWRKSSFVAAVRPGL